MTNKELSVIIPCYNEAPDVLNKTITEIKNSLTSVENLNWEIIVVNDGSLKYDYSDWQADTSTRMIHHRNNRGYGAALKTGIKNANYDWIAITDADGTYPNTQFHELIAHCPDVDMIVGARPWKHISALRRLPKYILTRLASFLARYPIKDLNSGMRIFRKSMALEFWRLYPNGFSFTSTITMACVTNNYNLKYHPIAYSKRTGKSHIHPIKDTIRFFSLVMRLTLYFNPLRIFMPLSIIFAILAVARGIRDYILVESFGGLTLVLFFMAFQVFFFGLLAETITKTSLFSKN